MPKPEALRLLWNEFAAVAGWPICRELGGKRGQRAARRLAENPDLALWRAALEKVKGSGFLNGRIPGSDGRFYSGLTIEFLTWDGRLSEILEGKYDDRRFSKRAGAAVYTDPHVDAPTVSQISGAMSNKLANIASGAGVSADVYDALREYSKAISGARSAPDIDRIGEEHELAVINAVERSLTPEQAREIEQAVAGCVKPEYGADVNARSAAAMRARKLRAVIGLPGVWDTDAWIGT